MARTTEESRRAARAEALRLYHDEGLTAAQAADGAGVHERTVRRWLGTDARAPGPQPRGGFPAALWRAALAAGQASGDDDVTAVCPEHEPGGRVLAVRVTPGGARSACGAHYRASGHARPWVMDADRWDALLAMARDSGG